MHLNNKKIQSFINLTIVLIRLCERHRKSIYKYSYMLKYIHTYKRININSKHTNASSNTNLTRLNGTQTAKNRAKWDFWRNRRAIILAWNSRLEPETGKFTKTWTFLDIKLWTRFFFKITFLRWLERFWKKLQIALKLRDYLNKIC